MKVVTVGGHDDEEALGLLELYVDDMAVVGGRKEGAWVKFCGFELSKRGDQFSLGQKSYAQDLLSRHPGVICKSTPFPGVLDEEPESEVSIQDVRAAQGIVGELLWLSCRRRPDLSFGVS